MEVENALNNTVSALSQSVAKKRRFTQMQEKELTKLEQEVKYLEKEIITKEEILKFKRLVKIIGQSVMTVLAVILCELYYVRGIKYIQTKGTGQY